MYKKLERVFYLSHFMRDTSKMVNNYRERSWTSLRANQCKLRLQISLSLTISNVGKDLKKIGPLIHCDQKVNWLKKTWNTKCITSRLCLNPKNQISLSSVHMIGKLLDTYTRRCAIFKIALCIISKIWKKHNCLSTV
jgi:hypothetical protein